MNFDVASEITKTSKQNRTKKKRKEKNVKRNTTQQTTTKIITKQKTKLQHRLFFFAFSFLCFVFSTWESIIIETKNDCKFYLYMSFVAVAVVGMSFRIGSHTQQHTLWHKMATNVLQRRSHMRSAHCAHTKQQQPWRKKGIRKIKIYFAYSLKYCFQFELNGNGEMRGTNGVKQKSWTLETDNARKWTKNTLAMQTINTIIKWVWPQWSEDAGKQISSFFFLSSSN